jgi:hypothetical protein
MPNTAWRSVAERSAVTSELRQLPPRGVEAVDQLGRRPGRDVLDEEHQHAAQHRRSRQVRLEPCVPGTEERAVLHMEREADASPPGQRALTRFDTPRTLSARSGRRGLNCARPDFRGSPSSGRTYSVALGGLAKRRRPDLAKRRRRPKSLPSNSRN